MRGEKLRRGGRDRSGEPPQPVSAHDPVRLRPDAGRRQDHSGIAGAPGLRRHDGDERPAVPPYGRRARKNDPAARPRGPAVSDDVAAPDAGLRVRRLPVETHPAGGKQK